MLVWLLFAGWGVACVAVAAQTTEAAGEEMAAPPAVERLGMTWGSGAHVSSDPDITYVGCHGLPLAEGRHCDPYHGDTACSQLRPVLCIQVDGRAPPPGQDHRSFQSGWAYGRIDAAPRVRGDRFASRAAADAYCAASFGAGWRMAEHHDGHHGEGGWGLVANGHIDGSTRLWVAINDQPANCWDSAKRPTQPAACHAADDRCAHRQP